ncbi:MAG: hypothetical protein V4608_02175 [Bacteroidota bacterium]
MKINVLVLLLFLSLTGSSKSSKASSLRRRYDRSNLNDKLINKEIASVLKNAFAMTECIFGTRLNIDRRSLQKGQQFDKQVFYKLLETGDSTQINNLLVSVKTVSQPDRDAYEGALLMRKAGLTKNKKKQLSLFKEGRLKLDDAILKNNENCEFKFLRLIIQENAPPILGYNKQINEDSTFIKKNYTATSALLQKVILDYSKKSKNLNL